MHIFLYFFLELKAVSTTDKYTFIDQKIDVIITVVVKCKLFVSLKVAFSLCLQISWFFTNVTEITSDVFEFIYKVRSQMRKYNILGGEKLLTLLEKETTLTKPVFIITARFLCTFPNYFPEYGNSK